MIKKKQLNCLEIRGCNSSDKHRLAYQVSVHTNPKVTPKATA